MIHADTSFLVDLLRETSRKARGPAVAFLEGHASLQFGASVFASCELESGVARAVNPDRERARVRSLLQSIEVVYPDERFAPIYGELAVRLWRAGRTVSQMDLLIAAAAVVEGAPLVTANEKHFADVPSLKVLSYRQSKRSG